MFFFFFSSRRRHTRCGRDWSSDVCSSDLVDHIQSSWVTQGMKVGQVALGFGADDLGSVMIEENVVSAAGTTHRSTTEEFVRAIKALGKIPVQRDTLYRDVKVWN